MLSHASRFRLLPTVARKPRRSASKPRRHPEVAVVLVTVLGLLFAGCSRTRSAPSSKAPGQSSPCLVPGVLTDLTARAVSGDANAAYRVYLHHAFCSASDTDLRPSLQRAADLHHPAAEYMLGTVLTDEGRPNEAAAMLQRSLRHATEQGDIDTARLASVALRELGQR